MANNGYQNKGNGQGGGGNNQNRRGKNNNNQNRIKEKQLGLKTAKVAAYQRIFDEQVKSLERHELILKGIIPENFVQLVVSGRTSSLPKPESIKEALNSYFAIISLNVTGDTYRDIIKFLGDYQGWRDRKMAEFKNELNENIIINTTDVEPENN